MKINAKAFLREQKNKTIMDDFPEITRVVDLKPANDLLVQNDKEHRRIRIKSAAPFYKERETGEIKPIGRKLKAQNNKFICFDNTFGVTIDKTLFNGVLFDDGVHTVNMIPVLEEGKSIEGKISEEDEGKVIFTNFVENDTLEYLLKENGMKENIIIPFMRETYEYSFQIITKNLFSSLNREGTMVTFLDKDTRDKVFVMGNLFMFDKEKNQSKAIHMVYEKVADEEHLLTIIPNAKWINADTRAFPVTIDPQIEIVDQPIVTLTEYRNSMSMNGMDEQLLLGMKNGMDHSISVNIQTLPIISELIKNNLTKFNASVALHFEHGMRFPNSKGVSVYNGSTLLSNHDLAESENSIVINITSLIKTELEGYKRGRFFPNVRLEILYAQKNVGSSTTDGYQTSRKIVDDYVLVMDRFHQNEELRPELHLSYIKDGEVVEGTPFLNYETGKSGKTALNLFNSEVAHSLELGVVEADALKVGIGLNYDTRFLKEQKQNNLKNTFGKGWRLNVCQRLIKNTDYNKLLGSKDITYFDGNNNPHILREKWYYEKEDVRHYIKKDLVYIDNDQKLKYKDDFGVIQKVEYEVSNEEGLSFISTDSKMNYIKRSDMKISKKYFMKLANNVKRELYLSNGKLGVPHFYLGKEEWENATNTPDWIECLYETQDSIQEQMYSMPEKVSTKNGLFYDQNGNQLKSSTKNCPLLFKDGKYYIRVLKKQYKVKPKDKDSVVLSNMEVDGMEIPIEVVKEYYVDRSKPIVDYYENEDIANLNSQLSQLEDYIVDLKNQTKATSKSLGQIENELKLQTYYQEKDKEESVSTKETYRRNISSYKDQLEEQQAALQKLYKKLADSETQLANLKETKETLVKEQKKGVQDYIIDQTGNILGFDYFGKLVYICDSYENEIHIRHDDNKITEISSKKQTMVFHYSDDNILDYVIDVQGRRRDFTYDSEKLIKIKYTAENNVKQETIFAYDTNDKLMSILDPSGLNTILTWNEHNVQKVMQKTSVKTISSLGVTNQAAKTISNVSIKQNENSVDITDELSNVKTSHFFDFSGRLLTSQEEDLDSNKAKLALTHYENNNKLFEFSYKKEKLAKTIPLTAGKVTSWSKVINIKTGSLPTSLNPNKIPIHGMMFMSVDLSEISEDELQLNEIKLTAKVTDSAGASKNYTMTYTNLYPRLIGLPFILKRNDKAVTFYIQSTKPLNFVNIEETVLYEASGEIYYYNEKDQIVKKINGHQITEYADFKEDRPTTIKTTDEFGVVRTIHQLFDSFGRTVFEEDHLQNCKETFYDEKGNVMETRAYNKECPTLVKVSKVKYDEHGNATEMDGFMRDEHGQYPQKSVQYVPNSSKMTAVKEPGGQVTCYGYDFYTDDLLEISSDAAGQGNSTRMKYRYGLLTSLTHHGFTIDYTLDGQGRKTRITIAGQEMITNEYVDDYSDETVKHGSKVTAKTTPNGFEVSTIKDKEGRLASTISNDGDHISYTYDKDDQLIEIANSTGERIKTVYHEKGAVIEQETTIHDMKVIETNTFGEQDFVTQTKQVIGDKVKTTTYFYDEAHDNRLSGIELENKVRLDVEYDALSRVTKKTLSNSAKAFVEDEFEYLQYGENSLDFIQEHHVKVGGKLLDTVSYTYDVAGNITSIIRDEFKTRYTYDKLNRLLREDNPRLNQTIIMKYDHGGNILLKKVYPYTLETEVFGGELSHYTYQSNGWKDQLIDLNGKTISYDSMGRPLKIGETEITWSLKGEMTSFGSNSYTYNMNGIRTSKTMDGITTKYFLSGSKILREMSNEKDIIYQYGMEKLVGMSYNGVNYIYERNIQGDVLRIYQESDLKLVAEYGYDAWGNHEVINHTNENIGDHNPFRYRGYYFDRETGLYYLNARYYDPKVGRFISPDTLSILDETRSQINGLNLYMYCGNNPVMNIDPSGHSFWSVLGNIGRFVGGLVIAAVGVAAMGALIYLTRGLVLLPGAGTLFTAALSLTMYGGFMMASSWDKQINADMDAISWNPFNSDASLAANASKVSFYKGQSVVHSKVFGGTFSAGIMFIDSGWHGDANTIKHEWGHFAQLLIMGPVAYGGLVGFPSVYYNKNGGYLSASYPNDERLYYSKIWERTADWLGGARSSSTYDPFWKWSNFNPFN